MCSEGGKEGGRCSTNSGRGEAGEVHDRLVLIPLLFVLSGRRNSERWEGEVHDLF